MNELEKLQKENEALKEALVSMSHTAYNFLLDASVRNFDEQLIYVEYLTGVDIFKERMKIKP